MVFQEKEKTQGISVSHLSNGIYFLYLETEEGMLIKKFVKE
ncbi:MAG: hypothetical protein ACI840_001429 [Ulvibacter sp.]|jgi:hypothetical protein